MIVITALAFLNFVTIRYNAQIMNMLQRRFLYGHCKPASALGHSKRQTVCRPSLDHRLLRIGFALLLYLCLMFSPNAGAERTQAPEEARVYFIAPQDGAVVDGAVKVVMGLSGLGIAPAGTDVPRTGHHHLLIDTPLPDLNRPVPADIHHLHFGGGQTEATIQLQPGVHTLQLLLADLWHIPHVPPVYSERITITVQ